MRSILRAIAFAEPIEPVRTSTSSTHLTCGHLRLTPICFPTGEHDAYLGPRLRRSAQTSGYDARRDRHGRRDHRSIHDQCSRPRRPAAARQAAGRDVPTTSRRRASADPQPYHLYLTRAVELSTPQYAELPERNVLKRRPWHFRTLARQNRTAVLRGSPTNGKRSDEGRRHSVG
jgi:hypothetical protein